MNNSENFVERLSSLTAQEQAFVKALIEAFNAGVINAKGTVNNGKCA